MKSKVNTLVALAVKGPKLFKLIKAIKLLKFAKPMVTMISIVISVGAYAIIYDPWIAVGLVALIFVHEMGHVVAMNNQGFKTSGPVFIPFLGAALFAPKDMNRRQEAIIGIGGPILGSLAAFLLIGLYFIFDAKWMLMMGYIGIFLNLFNMIPISPLDGGRVTQAVGKWFKFVGFAMLLALTISMGQPGMLLIWIIVLFDFHFIPIKGRFALAVITELAMIALLTAGVGIHDNSEFWVTCFDALVGGFYLGMIGFALRRNQKDLETTLDENSKRPHLTMQAKINWFLVWLITTAILFTTMLLLAPSLKIIMVS